jgi:hypothetical protein
VFDKCKKSDNSIFNVENVRYWKQYLTVQRWHCCVHLVVLDEGGRVEFFSFGAMGLNSEQSLMINVRHSERMKDATSTAMCFLKSVQSDKNMTTIKNQLETAFYVMRTCCMSLCMQIFHDMKQSSYSQ